MRDEKVVVVTKYSRMTWRQELEAREVDGTLKEVGFSKVDVSLTLKNMVQPR